VQYNSSIEQQYSSLPLIFSPSHILSFSLGITSLQTNAYESSVQLEKYVQVMHPWL
jgi:hypothetical protein